MSLATLNVAAPPTLPRCSHFPCGDYATVVLAFSRVRTQQCPSIVLTCDTHEPAIREWYPVAQYAYSRTRLVPLT